MNEKRTQRLSCFHILIIEASVCGNLITAAIVYDLAIILSALSIVPFFAMFFPSGETVVLLSAPVHVRSRTGRNGQGETI